MQVATGRNVVLYLKIKWKFALSWLIKSSLRTSVVFFFPQCKHTLSEFLSLLLQPDGRKDS